MGPVIEIALGSGTPMTHDEKLFFKQLGARIAALRKDQGLTQVQLAQAPGAHPADGRLLRGRPPARAGLAPAANRRHARRLPRRSDRQICCEPAKRGPAPKLQQQIERIQQLPKSNNDSSWRCSIPSCSRQTAEAAVAQPQGPGPDRGDHPLDPRPARPSGTPGFRARRPLWRDH